MNSEAHLLVCGWPNPSMIPSPRYALAYAAVWACGLFALFMIGVVDPLSTWAFRVLDE